MKTFPSPVFCKVTTGSTSEMEDVVGARAVKRGKHSALPAGTLVVEPEASRRTEDYRVLDLTDDGLPCVPERRRTDLGSVLIVR